MSGASRYARRFTFVYFALAAVAGAAIAAFLLLGFSSGADSTATGSGAGGSWSSWQPSSQGLPAVSDIANYVASRYRLASGDQAVLIRGDLPAVAEQVGSSTAPTITRAPILSFAVPVLQNGQIAYLTDTRVAIEYQMCGTGPSCSIPTSEGPPTVARGLLLRRAALELALYTFRYVQGVDVVVVLYPPPPGDRPRYLFYFDRGLLSDELSMPLSETLGPRVPLPGQMSAAETSVVERLTGAPFSYRYILQPDGTAQMVLIAPDTTQASLGSTAGG
jgi:hypothetical protein